MYKRPLLWRIFSGLFITVIVLFSILPVLWMISTSIKTTQEETANPPVLIPEHPTLQGYIDGWQSKDFTGYLLNTVYVSVITTVVCVSMASLAGYGFSRFFIRGKNLILTIIFVFQMFPTTVVIIPYFLMMSSWNLLNDPWSLIISYTSFSLPLCIWMLKAFFDAVPQELDEAACLDGCNSFQSYWHIILPLTRPGMIASVIFTFLGAWKEYLFALTLCSKQKQWVLSVAITSFIGEHSTSWNQMMAVSLLTMTPIIITFLFLQNYLIGGMTAGAVKS